MQYHVAEFMLFEVGLSKNPLFTNDVGPEFQRLELLWACLQANKSFFDAFLSAPVSDYFFFSVPTWSHCAYSLLKLHVLSTFEHPGWNQDYVKETHDFWVIIDRCIERYQSVETVDGNDLFSTSAKRMRQIKAHMQGGRYGSGRACQFESTLLQAPGPLADDVELMHVNEDFDFMPFVDEEWLRDMLQPWDYQFTGMGD